MNKHRATETLIRSALRSLDSLLEHSGGPGERTHKHLEAALEEIGSQKRRGYLSMPSDAMVSVDV